MYCLTTGGLQLGLKKALHPGGKTQYAKSEIGVGPLVIKLIYIIDSFHVMCVTVQKGFQR